MLREQSNTIYQVHKLLDICFTVAAFVSAYFIKIYMLPQSLRGLIATPNYFTVLLIIIIIWPISFNYFKLYASYRTQTIKQISLKVIKAVFLGIVILNFAMYLLKINDVSRIMMGIFFLTNIFLLILSKSFIYKILKKLRLKGYNLQNVLIIGGRERAKDVINSIYEHTSSGYRILGCIGINEPEIGKTVISGTTYIGIIGQLEKILIDQVVDQIIFAIPLDLVKNIEKYIRIAEKLGVSVRFMPEWNLHKICYRPGIENLKVEEFLGIPTMCLSSNPNGYRDLQLKYMLDIFGAAILIILLLPVFGIISILIKIFSKGPVLFTQERCGLNGRRFYVYKLRTMVNDAEQKRKILDAKNEADPPAFKIKKDPRIIPYIGTFLRKTGLDELPQLFNVIKGEMSLVGPRPPIPTEVQKYDLWQRRRLSMKPGITCLWQCEKKRNDITFKEWMSSDLNYIDSWSIKLDLKILVKTAMVVFTGQGR